MLADSDKVAVGKIRERNRFYKEENTLWRGGGQGKIFSVTLCSVVKTTTELSMRRGAPPNMKKLIFEVC